MKQSKNVFLAAFSMILLLTACADDTGSKGTNASEQIDTPETTDIVTEAPDYILPPNDFGGESFQLLVGEGYNVSFADSENGEPLNDAKYQMKRTAEEGLNIVITETETDFWTMNQTVNQLIMSGDTTYDAMAMMDRYALSAAMEGNFIPLSDIETVQADAVWWGGNLSSKLTVGGKQYFGIASCQLETFGKTACILWNRTLSDGLGITIPYDDVYAGTWTIDDLWSYAGIANKDLNGDGAWTEVDQYTYSAGDMRGTPSQIWQACGLTVIGKDADDLPVMTAQDDEKLFDVLSDLYDHLYSGENSAVNYFNLTTDVSMQPCFLEGRSLIYISGFNSIVVARAMEDDFAVLPLPKYDESQDTYLSRTYDSTFFMVPVTQDDIEFSGAVLDAMACIGHYDLLPVYVETVLKEKASRDADSMKCIQICFDNRTLDFGEAFLFDHFGDQTIFDQVMRRNEFNTASFFTKRQKNVDKQLEKIIDAFMELD